MQIKEQDINRILTWLLAVSAVIRGILAAWLELGNDEVYYWTYALYPDWSHFDHPPMVGWMIQLFSLNLLFDNEFFIRLASVVIMTANTYIIYRIGKDIKDTRTGLYAALLYTASIYSFVITGIFIMPDTPLMLFWLLAVWMAIKSEKNQYLVFFGLFAGLAMLSKYSGIFLWGGMLLYILVFNRKQLKNPYLYLSIIVSIVLCLPVLYWNAKYNFVSFGFHGDRVSLFGKPNLHTFCNEIAGEFFYNNPVVFVLSIIAVIAAFKKKTHLEKPVQQLILSMALPMILVFWLFAFTRPTLPHWDAPAYVLLSLLAACHLRDKTTDPEKLPKPITAALCVLLLTLVVGAAEIKTGFIPLDRHTEPEMLGRDDFTSDIYGWRQLGKKFAALREEKIAEGVMDADDGIVADKWFPLANLDYYVARPLKIRAMGLGWPDQLHKYLWINDKRDGLRIGEDYWFLTDSRYLKDPKDLYKWYFKEIKLVGTIQIERCGKPMKNFFVYTCKGLIDLPPTLSQFMASAEADTTSRQ